MCAATSAEEVYSFDGEKGVELVSTPFSELSIAKVIKLRKLNGLTFETPTDIPDSCSILEQVVSHPPRGWESLWAKMTDHEFKLIQRNLDTKLAGEYYPSPKGLIFAAFHYTPLKAIKVVIVGQDPYHGYGQATGLSFSVKSGKELQPSLRNIFKELKRDYPDFVPYRGGDLTHWAQQGVLMLNTNLTVRPNLPDSHKSLWIAFLNRIVKAILNEAPQAIFVLWGRHAQSCVGDMIGTRVTSIKASHPSPKSAHVGNSEVPAFNGCGHFSQINAYLEKIHQSPIKW